MKNKITTNVLAFLLICSLNVRSQTTLPYFTGFDNSTQQLGWTQYKKAGIITGGWQYMTPNAYTAPTALYQIYSPSENLDNWFVSPGFSIPASGNMDSIRYMFNGLSTPSINDTIALYILNGSQDPSLATKTLLFDIRGIDYVNDGIYRKKINLALPAGPGSSYFAIRFKCDQGVWLETRFDNLKISGFGNVPVASFSMTSNPVCKGQSIIFTDMSTNTPTAWTWQFPGGTPSVSTISNPTVSFSTAGVYSVSLISSNSFVGASNTAIKTVTVNACTEIFEQESNYTEIVVYPNPGQGIFSIDKYSDQITSYSLYNVLGQIILKNELKNGIKNEFNIEKQPNGIYFLNVSNGTQSKTVKIIKE